jgi:hypothetical protein
LRIRSIKPEFWRSDDIAALPITARLLFIGLWSYVDDNGVGSDKVSSIAADLFAADLEADPTETFRRVSADATCLEGRGLIIRYRSAGKPLLYVTNWERHQVVKNPSKGHLYPLPPAELLEPFALLPSVYVDPGEGLGTGAGEQGNRGTEDQGSGGGASAPLSPFCSKHPNGTENRCRACGTARVAFEAEKHRDRTKPAPVPFTVVDGALCPEGRHQLVGDGTCSRCTYRPA